MEKDAGLAYAVRNLLDEHMPFVALPWVLIAGTDAGLYSIRRLRASDDKPLVTVGKKGSRWVIASRIFEDFPDTAPGAHEAMELADQTLNDQGYALIEGRPTATPWEYESNHSRWNRKVLGGAPLAEVARIWLAYEHVPPCHKWTLTHLSGPGPYSNPRSADDLKWAKYRADKALEEAGWTLT